MNKLSHSSVSKFQECPEAWNLHYNKKLRPKFQSSALCFGTGIDKALEAVLKESNIPDHKPDPKMVFSETWEKQWINKKLVLLPDNPNIVYSDSDVDYDLISEKSLLHIKEKFGENWEIAYQTTLEKKENVGFKRLSEEERSFINYVAWHSLEAKGLLMIDAFIKQIVPKIKNVLALQKEISLENADGDKITGFADLVCEWHDGSIVVIDFKTSTRKYEDEAVLTSPQLSLYVHALYPEYKTRYAGYIVLNKKVNKNKTKVCSKCGFNGTGNRSRTCPEEINSERCKGEWLEKLNPEIYIQEIIDEIPEQTENIVLDNIDFINESIKTGVFHRNFQSCVKPWGKCTFFDLCYKNDDSELIQIEK